MRSSCRSSSEVGQSLNGILMVTESQAVARTPDTFSPLSWSAAFMASIGEAGDLVAPPVSILNSVKRS